MKIAILGDLHGNIDALLAVHAEAQQRSVDAIYHLGDLGGYAPFINEVTAFLIREGIDGVQGNYDEAVANDREHCGCKYEDALQAEMAELGFAWTKHASTDATKAYLRALPKQIVFRADDRTFALFHATPHKNNIYWTEERPDKFFREMSHKLAADVFIFGHTHKPFRKDLDKKIFINAGSVGKPKDGDPRACLTIVEATSNKITTEFVRLAYDVERTAGAIIELGLPPYFAGRLRQGR